MKKILLIEDDVAIAKLYKLKLELHDYVVKRAVNGLEGLAKARSLNPDIILLDLRMPVMGGEEFLKKFRSADNNNDTPILVLTNISRDEAPKTLWHYGISGYFVKAHNTPADLLKIVEDTLKA